MIDVADLPETVTVERLQRTETAGGGLPTSAVTKAPIRCRIRPLSVNERTFGEAMRVRASHAAYTLPSADVVRDDQWTRSTGTKFKVVGTLDPSDLSHHRKILLSSEAQGV